MDRHTIIFTTDKRQKHLGELLPGSRELCSFPEYERRRKLQEENTEKIYVLPTPVSKLEQNETIKEKIKELLKNESKKENITVFGGAITREWKTFLEEHEIRYIDFMEQKEVVEGNAKITAEGVIAELLSKSSVSFSFSEAPSLTFNSLSSFFLITMSPLSCPNKDQIYPTINK